MFLEALRLGSQSPVRRLEIEVNVSKKFTLKGTGKVSAKRNRQSRESDKLTQRIRVVSFNRPAVGFD